MTRRMAMRLCVLLALAGLLLCGCGRKVEAPQNSGAAVDVLRSEVAALELLNRMALRPEQVGRLNDLLKGAQEFSAHQRTVEREQDKLAPLLAEKRDLIATNRPVSSSLDQQIATLSEAADAPFNDQALGKLGHDLQAVLTPDQVRVITADALAKTTAEGLVRAYRDLPDESFNHEIRAFSEELAHRSGVMKPEGIEGLFREVRSLSEQEYQDSHAKLVDQVVLLYAAVGPEADAPVAWFFVKPSVADAIARRAAGKAA